MTKILVADDEQDVRDLLTDILLDSGYEVIEAADGGAALDKATSERPDLILLDVLMPVMDGLQVLRRLRENPAMEEIPVILLTAFPVKEDESLGNTFRYKGFSVYALFDAQIGGDIYNGTRQWPLRENNGFDNDQTGKTENLKKPIEYYTVIYNVNGDNSFFVESGEYLKFRELSVRYSFNRGQLEGFANGLLNRISISVVGRNIKTWTGYTGYDPEVSSGGDQGVFRVDDFDYPNFKTWTGSIEIEF